MMDFDLPRAEIPGSIYSGLFRQHVQKNGIEPLKRTVSYSYSPFNVVISIAQLLLV